MFHFFPKIVRKVKNFVHLVRAVIAAVYFGFPAKKLIVIGVTGTDGKTTTSTILYHLLKHSNLPVALVSTVGAYIGNESLDTGFHVTSPNPWALQKLLKKILEKNYKYVVLEATSHGLDQHRLFGSNIKIGVLTNITREHLDYHKTYDAYLKAKAKLFDKTEVAVLNTLDMSYKPVKRMLHSKVTLFKYDHSTLTGKLKQAVTQSFPEPYNQLNATAAIQVAQHLGVTQKDLVMAIKSFPGIPGRMQVVSKKNGFKSIVDFAHTPNGLENALKALRPQTKGKLIAVYGSAGLRDYEKRPMMGKIGSQLADEVILTAEDPRTESVWSIIDQMQTGIISNRGHIHAIPDRQEAINFAVKIAKKGDIVAVLGKGHEKSMCFGKIEYPWSDQKALIKALEELS